MAIIIATTFEQVTVFTKPYYNIETISIPEWAESVQISSSGKYKFMMENSEGKHFNTAIIATNGGANLYTTKLPKDRKVIHFLNMEYQCFDIYVVFRSYE